MKINTKMIEEILGLFQSQAPSEIKRKSLKEIIGKALATVCAVVVIVVAIEALAMWVQEIVNKHSKK